MEWNDPAKLIPVEPSVVMIVTLRGDKYHATYKDDMFYRRIDGEDHEAFHPMSVWRWQYVYDEEQHDAYAASSERVKYVSNLFPITRNYILYELRVPRRMTSRILDELLASGYLERTKENEVYTYRSKALAMRERHKREDEIISRFDALRSCNDNQA